MKHQLKMSLLTFFAQVVVSTMRDRGEHITAETILAAIENGIQDWRDSFHVQELVTGQDALKTVGIHPLSDDYALKDRRDVISAADVPILGMSDSVPSGVDPAVNHGWVRLCRNWFHYLVSATQDTGAP